MGDATPRSDMNDASLEEILGEARVAYLAWIEAEMAATKTAARALGASGRPAAFDTVFGFFHDLKGGGGAVGLELLGAIGQSACYYLRGLDGVAERRASAVMLAHLSATERVAAADIRGDGGHAGKTLLQKLKVISEA